MGCALQLTIERLHQTSAFTLGRLTVDEVFECFTKEPPTRSDRAFIPGESGLPAGWFNVSIVLSKRFGMPVPLVVSSTYAGHGGARIAFGMRILPGQANDDGTGILVGQEQGPTSLYRTRAAYEALYGKLHKAFRAGHAIDLLIRSQ